MKRWISLFVAVVLAGSMLVGCGKTDTDYYMKGYDAMANGRYRNALTYFEKAAKAGDTHAEEAIKILKGYLNAEEAWNVGDIDAAKAFLETIPQTYKYYSIGEAVDLLKWKVYGGKPEDFQGDQDDEEKEKNGEITNAEQDSFVKQEEIDLTLQEIEILIESGQVDMAEEQLNGLREEDMVERQKQRTKDLRIRLAQRREEQKTQDAGQEDFTPEKALEYLQEAYPVEGDLGPALVPKYDANGRKYYEVTMQLGEGDHAEIATVQIFGDGTVRRNGE